MQWRSAKFTVTAVAALAILCAALLAFDGLLIGSSLRTFSRTAQSHFPGSRVDALIALASCRSCDRRDRNHAVWALGQLDDRRALAVLGPLDRGESLDPDVLRIALRHLRHQDPNRYESFLWRWMLPNES